jgi:hypothetical protein
VYCPLHYPNASGDFVYSIRDMDLLIGKRQCLGINSTKDLSDYHLQFIAITTWLINKGQLGNLEQQRAYIRALTSPLLSAIMNCLQLKNADHHPNVPHKVKAVYVFCLARIFLLYPELNPICQSSVYYTTSTILYHYILTNSNNPSQSRRPQYLDHRIYQVNYRCHL